MTNQPKLPEDVKREFEDRFCCDLVEGRGDDGDIYYSEMKSNISMDEVEEFIAEQLAKEKEITGETSDGYHTFNELYEFRKIYNAILFNEWSSQGKYEVHKSWRHSDGELCFGGKWFVVMATLPTGQISNHYEEYDWPLFQCEEREMADKWDGHTPQDVIKRLTDYLKPKNL